jgi:hypothetical protein
MPPLAPVVTPVTPLNSPVAANTTVANLAQPGGEPDAGPFTYAATSVDLYTVTGTALKNKVVLDSTQPVTVTATSAGGTSPATSATIVVTFEHYQGYTGNPQIRAPLARSEYWRHFLSIATRQLVPLARDGVDFQVARIDRTALMDNVAWDAARLGARPQTAIEQLAHDMAAKVPLYAEGT